MRRITVLSGHYGSGKSEIALNLAIEHRVDMVIDLDVVNPYFRVRSQRALLNRHNIHCVESTIQDAPGSDLPYISGEATRPFYNEDIHAIYDLAGTDSGAKLMRQYDAMIDPDIIDFYLVINIYRPDTQTVAAIVHLKEMLEAGAQLRFNGLINNSNMLEHTTHDDVLSGQNVLRDVSKRTGVPIVMTYLSPHLKFKAGYDGTVKQLTRYLNVRG